MFLTPRRVDTHELLDEAGAPRHDVERSLLDLRRINRYLGGLGIYRRMLRRILPATGQRVVVVDIGAGTCDLLDHAASRRPMLPIGLDFKIEHLVSHRDGSPARRVVGDAMRLPFRDRSVDAVTSAHFFHHFTAAENIDIVNEALRVARTGVAFNDTRRHYAPLLLVRLLSLFRLVGRITRHDAPASVLRAYTTDEARAVANASQGTSAKVIRFFPFRFAMIVRR